MAFFEDLREEESLHVHAGGVREGRRTCRLTEVSGPANGVLSAVLADPRVPNYGDAHPVESGLVVVEQSVKPAGGRGGTVTSVYRRPEQEELTPGTGAGVVEFSTFAAVESGSRRDAYGAEMNVTYSGSLGTDVVVGMFGDVYRTQVRATVKRAETTSGAALMRTLVNTTNNAIWSGDPAYTWKCEGIRSVPINRESAWLRFYDFIFDARTHLQRQEILFNGAVAPDASEPTTPGAGDGNGIRYFHVYPHADFSGFPVTIPST